MISPGNVCQCEKTCPLQREFEVKVGVHQGSVLITMLFIIMLEALSRQFHYGDPWEDLYCRGPCHHC